MDARQGGANLWRLPLAGNPAQPLTDFKDEQISSFDNGDVFVVKAGNKYELLASNPMGEVLMATPAISNGTIFVRGLKHLFAIAETSTPAASTDRRQR